MKAPVAGSLGVYSVELHASVVSVVLVSGRKTPPNEKALA